MSRRARPRSRRVTACHRSRKPEHQRAPESNVCRERQEHHRAPASSISKRCSGKRHLHHRRDQAQLRPAREVGRLQPGCQRIRNAPLQASGTHSWGARQASRPVSRSTGSGFGKPYAHPPPQSDSGSFGKRRAQTRTPAPSTLQRGRQRPHRLFRLTCETADSTSLPAAEDI